MARYTREIRVRVKGDPEIAKRYYQEGRKYIGDLANGLAIWPSNDPRMASRKLTNAHGVVFRAISLGAIPILEIDVSALSVDEPEETRTAYLEGFITWPQLGIPGKYGISDQPHVILAKHDGAPYTPVYYSPEKSAEGAEFFFHTAFPDGVEEYANVDWHNDAFTLACSWYGPEGRYFNTNAGHPRRKWVHIKGKRVFDTDEIAQLVYDDVVELVDGVSHEDNALTVAGAALRNVGSDLLLLVVLNAFVFVASDFNDYEVYDVLLSVPLLPTDRLAPSFECDYARAAVHWSSRIERFEAESPDYGAFYSIGGVHPFVFNSEATECRTLRYASTPGVDEVSAPHERVVSLEDLDDVSHEDTDYGSRTGFSASGATSVDGNVAYDEGGPLGWFFFDNTLWGAHLPVPDPDLPEWMSEQSTSYSAIPTSDPKPFAVDYRDGDAVYAYVAQSSWSYQSSISGGTRELGGSTATGVNTYTFVGAETLAANNEQTWRVVLPWRTLTLSYRSVAEGEVDADLTLEVTYNTETLDVISREWSGTRTEIRDYFGASTTYTMAFIDLRHQIAAFVQHDVTINSARNAVSAPVTTDVEDEPELNRLKYTAADSGSRVQTNTYVIDVFGNQVFSVASTETDSGVESNVVSHNPRASAHATENLIGYSIWHMDGVLSASTDSVVYANVSFPTVPADAPDSYDPNFAPYDICDEFIHAGKTPVAFDGSDFFNGHRYSGQDARRFGDIPTNSEVIGQIDDMTPEDYTDREIQGSWVVYKNDYIAHMRLAGEWRYVSSIPDVQSLVAYDKDWMVPITILPPTSFVGNLRS